MPVGLRLVSELRRRCSTTLICKVSGDRISTNEDASREGSRSRPADRRRPPLAATVSSNRQFVRGERTHLGHQSEAWAVARPHQGAGHRPSRQSRADSTPGSPPSSTAGIAESSKGSRIALVATWAECPEFESLRCPCGAATELPGVSEFAVIVHSTTRVTGAGRSAQCSSSVTASVTPPS